MCWGKEQVRITEEGEGHMQNIYLSSDFFLRNLELLQNCFYIEAWGGKCLLHLDQKSEKIWIKKSCGSEALCKEHNWKKKTHSTVPMSNTKYIVGVRLAHYDLECFSGASENIANC